MLIESQTAVADCSSIKRIESQIFRIQIWAWKKKNWKVLLEGRVSVRWC